MEYNQKTFNKIKSVLVIVTLSLLSVLIILVIYAGFIGANRQNKLNDVQNHPKLSVTGSAEMWFLPDGAWLNVSLYATGTTNVIVRNKINSSEQEIQDQLKDLGVSEADITEKSNNLSSNPYYSSHRELRIIVRKLNNVSDVKDIISSVPYVTGIYEDRYVSDSAQNLDQNLQNQIMGLAIKDATTKADIAAKQMKGKIGQVLDSSYNLSVSQSCNSSSASWADQLATMWSEDSKNNLRPHAYCLIGVASTTFQFLSNVAQ